MYSLSFFYQFYLFMMKAVDIASSETERETVKDTLLIKERKRKAKEKTSTKQD